MRDAGPRYAVIDMGSRRIVGVVDARNLFDACRKVDDAEGDYEEIAAGGYIVHIVPDDFECDDGQDQAAIDAVEAMPVAGYVRTLRTDE